MNYKHLSKYHYIYRISYADGQVFVEHYPIVYSNKSYIFYLIPGSEIPSKVDTDKAVFELNDELKQRLYKNVGLDRYMEIYNVPTIYYLATKEQVDGIQEFVDWLKSFPFYVYALRSEVEQLKRNLEWQGQTYMKLQKQYAAAAEKLRIAESKMKSDG